MVWKELYDFALPKHDDPPLRFFAKTLLRTIAFLVAFGIGSFIIIIFGALTLPFGAVILIPLGWLWMNPVFTVLGIWTIATILSMISYHNALYKETKRKEDNKVMEALKREREAEAEKQRAEEEKFEKKQLAKGLILYRGNWVTSQQARRLAELDLDFENNFAKYTPYEFEGLIQKLFERMGYKAWTTPGSGDRGADVIAEKNGERIAIQVKKYNYENLVTPSEVRSVLGSMHHYKAKKALVITTSNFTVKAWEIAETSPVELWEKNTLKETIKKYLIDR
jgi:HJR/Mrr/RecB family endonuclease